MFNHCPVEFLSNEQERCWFYSHTSYLIRMFYFVLLRSTICQQSPTNCVCTVFAWLIIQCVTKPMHIKCTESTNFKHYNSWSEENLSSVADESEELSISWFFCKMKQIYISLWSVIVGIPNELHSSIFISNLYPHNVAISLHLFSFCFQTHESSNSCIHKSK